MKEKPDKIRRFVLSAPFLAMLLSLVIVSFALFVPPVIGMADNGDFYRITVGEGIYKLDRYETDQYYSYASVNYGLYRYYNEFAAGGLRSSQSLFIGLAKMLCRLCTGSTEIFDIRFLGGIYLLYFAAALYFLVDYVTYHMRPAAACLTAGLCVFVFADTGYTAFFNSFFAEGLVLASFLFMLAALLLMTQERYRASVLMLLFTVNALILTTSRQQYAPLGLMAAAALVILVFMMTPSDVKIRERGLNRDSVRAYMKGRFRYRLAAFFCGAILCFAGVLNYLLIPQESVHVKAYHAMTRGVLMTADNPEKALTEFHIDPQYAILNRSDYYDRNPVIDPESPELRDNFYPKVGFAAIFGYYVRHPGQMMKMLDLAAKDVWKLRPDFSGNYDRSAGKSPGEKTGYFAFYSALKRKAVPGTVGFIIIWTLVLLIFGFHNGKRNFILAVSILMGISQILISIIGAGDTDLLRCTFLFGAAFDFASFISIAAFIFYRDKINELKTVSRQKSEKAFMEKMKM